MPELPDVTIYIEALQQRVIGHELRRLRVLSPFVLRTFDPPTDVLQGRRVVALRRIGKRIIFDFGEELFLVVHLMIAGRFHWYDGKAKTPAKLTIAVLEFDNGTLVFTEAGSKRRASLHVIRGEASLRALDPGGVEIEAMDTKSFGEILKQQRNTLKRALTDPHRFSGIGNAYSDEILHRARLSPVQMTTNLDEEEVERLLRATRQIMDEWTDRLRRETGDGFPEKVTAFRSEMAVHGKFGKPCPVCGSTVQRIVYADNETNYCARCQTEGRLLADRALSRLLREDWPKSIDDIE